MSAGFGRVGGCSYSRYQILCVLWGDSFDECAERRRVLPVPSVLWDGRCNDGVVGDAEGGFDVVPEFGEVFALVYLSSVGSVG